MTEVPTNKNANTRRISDNFESRGTVSQKEITRKVICLSYHVSVLGERVETLSRCRYTHLAVLGFHTLIRVTCLPLHGQGEY